MLPSKPTWKTKAKRPRISEQTRYYFKMRDIQNRADLEVLLHSFYKKLLQDPAINYIFTTVAQLDMEKHLPIIVNFWEQNLFHSWNYKNNVLQIHVDLNQKIKLSETHFSLWLAYFNQTVNELFSGVNAEKIMTNALSIATVMKIKLD